MLPIYEDLSREDLLQRCLGGHTQNANESFHALVWRLAPKHLHCGPKTVEIAAWIAAGLFNDGYQSILHIMKKLKFVIGAPSYNFAKKMDKDRLKRQELKSSSVTKEGRIAKKARVSSVGDDEDDLLYGPGITE